MACMRDLFSPECKLLASSMTWHLKPLSAMLLCKRFTAIRRKLKKDTEIRRSLHIAVSAMEFDIALAACQQELLEEDEQSPASNDGDAEDDADDDDTGTKEAPAAGLAAPTAAGASAGPGRKRKSVKWQEMYEDPTKRRFT